MILGFALVAAILLVCWILSKVCERQTNMIEKDGKTYAESLEEYYALCGDKEHKEGAQEIVNLGIDYTARYGLSDKEYDALKQPLRVYR